MSHDHRVLHRIDRKLNAILEYLDILIVEETEEIEAESAHSLDLTQEGATPMGVITGIAPGATETFDLSALPAGSLLQAGNIPTYTQDNTTDVSTLSVAADGMSFSVTGAATFAATSFNVTASAVSLSGSPLSQAFNIPLLAAAGVPATGLDLNQVVSGVTAAARRR